MTTCYEWRGNDLLLRVYVQPRASSDQVVGLYGEMLKLRITAPPVDGKANDHLLRVLATLFKVPRDAVTLVNGTTGRRKTFRIQSPTTLPEMILPP